MAIYLNTPRLTLRTLSEKDALQLLHFEESNRAHFSPWRTANLRSDYKDLLVLWEKEFEEDRSVRFGLFLHSDPNQLIGCCNFTQIFRGPFHACYLGYHIDKSCEGQGFMSEALQYALNYMFSERSLHRIMANYQPSNERSAKLLHKLGLEIEGVAKRYLFINDQWRDHVLTSLINDAWRPPPTQK